MSVGCIVCIEKARKYGERAKLVPEEKAFVTGTYIYCEAHRPVGAIDYRTVVRYGTYNKAVKAIEYAMLMEKVNTP